MDSWILEMLIFLPGILFLGVKTSYEDIKSGEIKNKWIVLAFIYAVIINLALYIYLYLSKIDISSYYFLDLSLNFVVSLVVGIILWNSKIWSAADAKLFAVFSLLLPLSVYSGSYYSYFPSFVLLINSFVPFFVYAFFRLIFSTSIKEKYESLVFNPKQIFLLFLSMVLAILIFSFLGFHFSNFLVIMVITLFILKYFNKIFDKKLIFSSIVLIIILLLFNYKNLVSFKFFYKMSYSIIMVLVIYFITRLGFNYYSTEISINNLRKGMILAEVIYKEDGGKKYKKATSQYLEAPGKHEYSFVLLEQPAEGLTDKDIKNIKRLFNQKKLSFSKIRIKQTVPFAPFILLGVLLTLIARGNFLNIIAKFIYSPN